MDPKRHAPLGGRRAHLRLSQPHSRSHPHLGRTRRPLGDIYVSDHADTRQGGRFRWLVSTCLAAAGGVVAILVVIAGSTHTPETDGGMLCNPPRGRARPPPPFRRPSRRT